MRDAMDLKTENDALKEQVRKLGVELHRAKNDAEAYRLQSDSFRKEADGMAEHGRELRELLHDAWWVKAAYLLDRVCENTIDVPF
jgi:predicted RNase H-like nuclease (RuvC/YqgF family)